MKGIDFTPELFKTLRHYDRKTFTTDLMAGIIVGIVALPLALALGIASGVTPEKGIITAIIAGFIISALGGSKVQIGGPTGAFIVIVYGIIQEYGLDGLMIATLMAGVFLVVLGVCRLGTIIKYIPYPIVVGFTSGIAVTIFTTQIKDLFGLTTPTLPAEFAEKWEVYFQHFSTLSLWNTAMGLLTVLIIVFTPRWNKKIPGSLVAIVLVTLVAVMLREQLGVTEIVTIGDRFSISAELPQPVIPAFSWAGIQRLIAPAITIALLGAIESLLSATVSDGAIGARHHSNTELIAQGIANIVTPLFGGTPATGAIARTMANVNNGGRSPISGIVHTLVLLLILLFLMPLAKYIPMSCLAGVLVVVSYGMSGWRSFVAIFRNPASDVIVLCTTFLLTVFFDLTIAIEVGILLACLLFMKRISETAEIRVLMNEIDTSEDASSSLDHEHLLIPERVEVYEINGPYFFGASNTFEDVMSSIGERPQVRIIRMRKVPFVDSTGIHHLENLIHRSHSEGITIILSGVLPKVKATLIKARICQLIGEENVCSHIDIALERAKALLAVPPVSNS